MYTHFKKVLILLCITGATLVCERAGATEASWAVLYPSVPGRIATSLAGENDVYYVLKQTHEPLLRKDDGQNYSSRILRSWGRNIRSSEYTFCPDTRLSFAGGERFTVFFLGSSPK